MRSAASALLQPFRSLYRDLLTVVVRFLDSVGELTQLLGQCVWSILTFSFSPGDVVEQMSAMGVNSLPLALLTITFSGMVLALYTAEQLVKLGLGNFVGGGVALSMAREAAPILAAIVVAARAGSSIAAEIGSMKVTEQVDALRALAVSPIEYLVVPRFIALIVMLPMITVLADVAGTAGGYFVASSVGVSSGSFLASIQQIVTLYDIWTGMMKTFVFGAIIALVSCRQGLNTSKGAAGVGRATTSAVVISIVLIYMADFFLVRFLFTSATKY